MNHILLEKWIISSWKNESYFLEKWFISSWKNESYIPGNMIHTCPERMSGGKSVEHSQLKHISMPGRGKWSIPERGNSSYMPGKMSHIFLEQWFILPGKWFIYCWKNDSYIPGKMNHISWKMIHTFPGKWFIFPGKWIISSWKNEPYLPRRMIYTCPERMSGGQCVEHSQLKHNSMPGRGKWYIP